MYKGKYTRKTRYPWPWGAVPPKKGKNSTTNYDASAPETPRETAGRIAWAQMCKEDER